MQKFLSIGLTDLVREVEPAVLDGDDGPVLNGRIAVNVMAGILRGIPFHSTIALLQFPSCTVAGCTDSIPAGFWLLSWR
ncbi:hypothetical protein [Streptomyces sp. NPDC048612]|uniref:hypothetical protein n=1 Tax=Streptomyces sp. NPDC048612 TaxID=3365579 RepID=UPI00371840DB